MKIKTLPHGLASLCLVALLTSCASKSTVRTETVEVAVPVIVAVPSELTDVPAEPVLPAGVLVNDDLANDRDAWRAWGRELAKKLREIATLGVGDESRPE